MRMNTLQPADGARTDRKRVGRGIGSGLGKTAGRGHKGSFARSGKGKIKAGFEGGQMPMQRRLPKVGFRSLIKKDTAEVLLYALDKLDAGDIDLAALKAAKLVPPNAKQAKIVKKGELTKKFVLKGVLGTAGAKAAIEAAGGSIAWCVTRCPPVPAGSVHFKGTARAGPIVIPSSADHTRSRHQDGQKQQRNGRHRRRPR